MTMLLWVSLRSSNLIRLSRRCHRAIWVRKPNGIPRRVVKFQSLNEYCICNTHHAIPRFQQVRSVPANMYLSVTDAWNCYHSVPVRKEYRHLLKSTTKFGRYRYKTAPQGFKASSDGYTHRCHHIISGVPRKTKIVNDTAIWDTMKDLETHWWRMINYLECVTECVTLNPKKLTFQEKNSKIDFSGFFVRTDTVKPLAKYIQSIKEFPQPNSMTDIRAWYG